MTDNAQSGPEDAFLTTADVPTLKKLGSFMRDLTSRPEHDALKTMTFSFVADLCDDFTRAIELSTTPDAADGGSRA